MASSSAQDPPEDDDPVEQEFDVYITSWLGADRQLYLFQHATRERDAAYNLKNGRSPLEIRMKSETGFVEVDIPLDTRNQYHKSKARKWGEALHQTSSEGGFGLASGLVNAQGPRGGRGRGRGAAAAEAVEVSASAQDSAPHMVFQTLGGQVIAPEPGTPQYMIGAFNEDQLHLTFVSGIVQMRPQFHNIDAVTLAEKTMKQRQMQSATGNGGAGGATRGGEPRAVTMTSKPTNDNEDASASDSKAILEKAQQETWVKMKFVDEEHPDAWTAFADHLFLQNIQTGQVTELISDLDNEKYLDRISARRESAKQNDMKKTSISADSAVGGSSSEPVSISDSESEGDNSEVEGGDEGDEQLAQETTVVKSQDQEADAMDIDG